MSYDRAVLVGVLVYHGRDGIKGCQCGWAELGRSHPEHVADVYERALVADRCQEHPTAGSCPACARADERIRASLRKP